MSKVILIRPGRTDYDDQQRIKGNLAIPLNKEGLLEVAEIIRRLLAMNLRPEAILTGPTDPAAKTANAISEAFPKARLREVDEFENVNQGLWQGLPAREVRRRHPTLFKQRKEDRAGSICPPEGETLADAALRVERVLERALRKYDNFVFVVPEPLATVVRCMLSNHSVENHDCLCGDADPPVDAIEIIEATAVRKDIFAHKDEPALVSTGRQETA